VVGAPAVLAMQDTTELDVTDHLASRGLGPLQHRRKRGLLTFRGHGLFPNATGQTIAPSTGMSGFDATYDPAGTVLKVILNVSMTFVDGFTIDATHVTANDPILAGATAGINKALSRLRGARLQTALQRAPIGSCMTAAAERFPSPVRGRGGWG